MFFCFVLLLLGHAKTLEDCFTQPCFITCGPAQWNSFKIIFFPFEIFGFCLVSHPFSKLDTTHSIISETLTQPLLVLQPRPHSDNTTANNCFLMKKHNIHAQFCAVLKRCGSDVHWAFCRPILAYFPRQYIGIYSVCSPVEKLSTPNNSVACSTTLSAITSTNLLHDFLSITLLWMSFGPLFFTVLIFVVYQSDWGLDFEPLLHLDLFGVAVPSWVMKLENL